MLITKNIEDCVMGDYNRKALILAHAFKHLINTENGKYVIDIFDNYGYDNSKDKQYIKGAIKYFVKKNNSKSMIHRDNKPAVYQVQISKSKPEIIEEMYYKEDKLDRENSPAIITYGGNYGTNKHYYYRNGLLHNISGPAIIRPTHQQEYIHRCEFYFVNGKKFEEWVPLVYKGKEVVKGSINNYSVMRTIVEFDREYGLYLKEKFL